MIKFFCKKIPHFVYIPLGSYDVRFVLFCVYGKIPWELKSLIYTKTLIMLYRLVQGLATCGPRAQSGRRHILSGPRPLLEIVYLSGPRTLYVIMTNSVANRRLVITI